VKCYIIITDRARAEEKEITQMKNTVWFKGINGGLYFFEELKLVWMDENPNERFDLGNFNAWADKKGFKRI
jgi:hypothetical protein